MPAVRSLLALALLLAAPASASAAPFGELPFRSRSGSATCLRATGAPGELVRATEHAEPRSCSAGPDGLRRLVANCRPNALVDCPQAMARPSGAGVVAFRAPSTRTPTTLVAGRRPRARAAPGGRSTDVAGRARSWPSSNALAAAVSDAR